MAACHWAEAHPAISTARIFSTSGAIFKADVAFPTLCLFNHTCRNLYHATFKPRGHSWCPSSRWCIGAADHFAEWTPKMAFWLHCCHHKTNHLVHHRSGRRNVTQSSLLDCGKNLTQQWEKDSSEGTAKGRLSCPMPQAKLTPLRAAEQTKRHLHKALELVIPNLEDTSVSVELSTLHCSWHSPDKLFSQVPGQSFSITNLDELPVIFSHLTFLVQFLRHTLQDRNFIEVIQVHHCQGFRIRNWSPFFHTCSYIHLGSFKGQISYGLLHNAHSTMPAHWHHRQCRTDQLPRRETKSLSIHLLWVWKEPQPVVRHTE